MISYLSLYSTTALPGDKLTAGMLFGLAEGISSIVSGLVCSKFKDNHAFTFFVTFSGISQLVFYFMCDGNTGSFLGKLSIFGTILGGGSCINIVYLMIE
jgi:hypothetical protein